MTKRKPGSVRGKVKMARDFDAPMELRGQVSDPIIYLCQTEQGWAWQLFVDGRANKESPKGETSSIELAMSQAQAEVKRLGIVPKLPILYQIEYTAISPE